VLELTVDEDAVVQRLLKRAEQQGRDDDTEEVIRERQAIYRRETAPLTEVYSGRGLLVQVDGMGTVDEVFERITAALRGAAAS
jgi:adenylate kinase